MPIRNNVDLLPIRNNGDLLPIRNNGDFLPVRNYGHLLPIRNCDNILSLRNNGDLLPIRNNDDLLPQLMTVHKKKLFTLGPIQYISQYYNKTIGVEGGGRGYNWSHQLVPSTFIQNTMHCVTIFSIDKLFKI